MKTKETNAHKIELLFRALADQTRLRLLNLIGDDEVCVCFLVEALNTTQPKISRHLAYLRRAGLVRGRKRGLWVFYSLAPAGSRFHRDLLACLGSCFQDVPELAKDSRKAERIRKAGGCCPA